MRFFFTTVADDVSVLCITTQCSPAAEWGFLENRALGYIQSLVTNPRDMAAILKKVIQKA